VVAVTAPAALDPTTRQAWAAAAEDARGRGHRHLGTGHLLLGVLATPGSPGAARLGAAGLLVHDVDLDVVRLVGYGTRPPPPDAGLSAAAAEDAFGPQPPPRRSWRRRPLPLTGCAREALRRAATEAAGTIGTDHLLRGLFGCTDGLAHRILAARGITPGSLG
jgi:hypothetical protein